MTRKSTRKDARPKTRLARRLAMLGGGLTVIALAITIRHYWGDESATAQPPRASAPPAARQASPPASSRIATAAPRPAAKPPAVPQIVAMVNGQEITRDDLARECLRHYGKAVLESLVNKYLIVQECGRHQITVTRDEVNAEIERMASRFGLAKDQWLEMLQKERGINPAQYADDIIWPTLALRKLAGAQLTVTPEEVQREFETQFGPSVQARLIMIRNPQTAQKVREAAAADPSQFGKLAKQYSEDVNSAAAEGLIQPIRRHVGYKEIEEAAFALKPGEVSPVVTVGDQHIILLCERHLPARPVIEAKVKPQLEEAIRDQKMRRVAAEVFRSLQESSQVVNVLNDPDLTKQMPGVAATINGNPIPLSALAEECIKRHGGDVLEGTINRTLIEQACKKHSITITDADLDEEIRQAASLSVPPKPDGSPDVDAYLELVKKEQKVSYELFRHDAVWPSVALKKLVIDKIEVTEEDIQRGFEANFGPRVRCRAIVLNEQRRATEVWQKARSNPTPQFFAELAKEYSVDATSASLGGEIPPVKRFGGQPELEKQAFKLAPGELSGIFSMNGKWVILLCEGHTDPAVQVSLEDVRKDLEADIHEKKLRIAMGKKFQELQDAANIDNYLANTSHSPRRDSAVKQAAAYDVPTLKQVQR